MKALSVIVEAIKAAGYEMNKDVTLAAIKMAKDAGFTAVISHPSEIKGQ